MRIAFGAVASIVSALLFCPAAAGGVQAPLSQAEVEGRLRLAMQVARERNDRALMRRVEDAARQVRAALERGDALAAEGALDDAVSFPATDLAALAHYAAANEGTRP